MQVTQIMGGGRVLSGQRVLAMLGIGVSLVVTACGGGGGGGTPPKVNHAPVANATAVRSDTGQSVKLNASDPDGDALTLAITKQGTAGITATANSDGTVTLSPVVKGLAVFNYKVTDPSGLSSSEATAAVFVGQDPFHEVFAADSGAIGGSSATGAYEVYYTDFATGNTKLSSASSGTVRLMGFSAASGGTSVVYRTQDTANSASNKLTAVKVSAPTSPISISLPSGVVPALNDTGTDQFVVSPDGNWVAVVGVVGTTRTMYLVNISGSSATVTMLAPGVANPPAVFVSKPTFSSDSKNLYFLATSVPGGVNRSLFVVAVASPGTVTLVSQSSVPYTSDDVSDYSVSPNQGNIFEVANRAGRTGVFLINPANLANEIPMNVTPDPGTAITATTVGLSASLGGTNLGDRIAYDVGVPTAAPQSVGAFVNTVVSAGTPGTPVLVAPIEHALGFSPDGSNLLVTDGSQVFAVATAGSGVASTQLGVGTDGFYDGTGNAVLLTKPLSPGESLGAWSPTFSGSAHFLPVTPSGTAAFDVDLSGLPREVLTFGQVNNTGTAPGSVNLQVVNLLLPSSSTPLAAATATPLDLTTSAAAIVN